MNKITDKFKVLIKSRNKGKVGTGTIDMSLRFDVPYEKLGEITTYLAKYKK
jgi:hypothetical protein